MKKPIIFLLGCLFTINVYGQITSPYQLKWKNEALILAGGAGMFSGSRLFHKERTSLKLGEINLLNSNSINDFDRSATLNFSEKADRISDVGMYGPAIGGFALSGLITRRTGQNLWLKEGGKLAIIWFETNLVNVGLTEITKVTTRRVRPLAYNPEVPWEKKEDFEIRKSFFSGHTSISASNMFFMAKVFSDYYPYSKWKPAVWSIAAIIPAITGYLRYEAGKHFPTDVITGYALGAAIGYFIPELHRVKQKDGNMIISFLPYNNLHGKGAILFITF